MMEWLSQYSPAQLSGLTAVIIGPLIAIVAIIAGAWASVRRVEARAQIAELEAALKQQMIERGMSADEIERVLAAGQNGRSKKNRGVEEPVA